MLKYKVGDRVVIIADSFNHRQKLGSVHTIDRVAPGSRKGSRPCDYQEYLLSCSKWVTETEIALSAVPMEIIQPLIINVTKRYELVVTMDDLSDCKRCAFNNTTECSDKPCGSGYFKEITK